MTIENPGNADRVCEVKQPEKTGPDNLKADRNVDTKLIERQRLIAGQDFSITDIDTNAIRQANAARGGFQLVDGDETVASSKKQPQAKDARLEESTKPISAEPARSAADGTADTGPPVIQAWNKVLAKTRNAETGLKLQETPSAAAESRTPLDRQKVNTPAEQGEQVYSKHYNEFYDGYRQNYPSTKPTAQALIRKWQDAGNDPDDI